MNEYSTLQEEVVNEAMRRLKETYDHDQVCVDQLPNDESIRFDREEAIDNLVIDTCYWDNLGPFALPAH